MDAEDTKANGQTEERSLAVLPPPDVFKMITERLRFAGNEETIFMASELLRRGYSVKEASEIVGVKPSTIWLLVEKGQLGAALAQGTKVRSAMLRDRILKECDSAVDNIVFAMNSPDTKPEARAEIGFKLLALAATAPGDKEAQDGGTTVDVDFEKRFARVVTTNPSKRTA